MTSVSFGTRLRAIAQFEEVLRLPPSVSRLHPARQQKSK